MRVKFIIPNIDRPYYLWQQLVQIKHFRELGLEQDVIYPVYYWGQPSKILQSFIDSPNIKAKIIPVLDGRKIGNYSGSMKPWLLYRYFQDNPKEVDQVFFMWDADVIFTKPFDFAPFENIKHKFYGSNTIGYTGADYIKGKGEMLLHELCAIAGLDPRILEERTGWEVGAQFVFQGTTADFWYEVYERSSATYKHMTDTATKYKPAGHEFPIQAWCAELYYTQWAAIKYGFEPEVTPLLRFSWANWNISEWEKNPIWHNAGQVKEDKIHFSKTTWQTSPFNKEITVSPKSISTKYVDLIRRTEQEFPELIWE